MRLAVGKETLEGVLDSFISGLRHLYQIGSRHYVPPSAE